MAYRIERFTPDRLPEVLELERALWSQDFDANARYFAWKYEQNPHIPEPRLFVALSAGRVVGVRGFHGTAWTADPDEPPIVTPTGGDTVVASEHRGRGLFERINRYALAELASEGFRMVCNFSAGPATYLLSLRGGWRSVGPYLPIARDRGSRARPLDVRAGVSVRIESEPRPGLMADLVSRRAGEDAAGRAIRLCRDREFCDWRYRNPLSRYHFVYATSASHGGDGPLRGFLVLQERLLKRQRGMRIGDWEADDASTFSALLAAAIDRVETERLSIWSATLPRPILSVLQEAGFEPYDDTRDARRYRPGPLVAAIAEDGAHPTWNVGGRDVTDLENWRLRMVCSDSL